MLPFFGTFVFCRRQKRFPALRVESAKRTAHIYLVVLTPIPFGFASPVILAFFAACWFFRSLERHVRSPGIDFR